MAGKTKKTTAGKAEKPVVMSGAVPEWSSTTAISKLLGKTVRRIQQLTQEGVLETEVPPGGGARKYRTCETVQRYIAHVEQKAQETGDNSRAAGLHLKKRQAVVDLTERQVQKVCHEYPATHGRHHVQLCRRGDSPGHGKNHA